MDFFSLVLSLAEAWKVFQTVDFCWKFPAIYRIFSMLFGN